MLDKHLKATSEIVRAALDSDPFPTSPLAGNERHVDSPDTECLRERDTERLVRPTLDRGRADPHTERSPVGPTDLRLPGSGVDPDIELDRTVELTKLDLLGSQDRV